MKIFLDANILFSAAIPGSRMSLFLGIIQRSSALVTNQYAIEEAQRNLARKNPAFLHAFNELLNSIDKSPILSNAVNAVIKDKDRPILGTAIKLKCTHLLTGDERDFGHLFGTIISGVKIVNAKMLAEEFVQLGIVKKSNSITEGNQGK